MQVNKTLLSFGHGYSARALSRRILSEGCVVYGTTRSEENAAKLQKEGVRPLLWGQDISQPLNEATHLLSSIAPAEGCDPVIELYGDAIQSAAPSLEWVGYLSTTGVYGDHGGAWVDETTPLTPSTERGKARVAAEAQWQAVPGLALHIFRLAGIYGPGRGPFAKVLRGTARRIIKKNQVFSRIHVEDIAEVLLASMGRPQPGAIYNICDDMPVPPEDVIAFAAELLGYPVPASVPIEQADLSPMARSFYAESKRVSNAKVKANLDVRLLYPDYKTGLRALLADVTGKADAETRVNENQ